MHFGELLLLNKLYDVEWDLTKELAETVFSFGHL